MQRRRQRMGRGSPGRLGRGRDGFWKPAPWKSCRRPRSAPPCSSGGSSSAIGPSTRSSAARAGWRAAEERQQIQVVMSPQVTSGLARTHRLAPVRSALADLGQAVGGAEIHAERAARLARHALQSPDLRPACVQPLHANQQLGLAQRALSRGRVTTARAEGVAHPSHLRTRGTVSRLKGGLVLRDGVGLGPEPDGVPSGRAAEAENSQRSAAARSPG